MHTTGEDHETTILKRWKKAVIHLEGVTDQTSAYERQRGIDELVEKLDDLAKTLEPSQSPVVPSENFGSLSVLLGSEKRYHGTAVFLRHEEKRYLITARHVLHDEDRRRQEIEEAQRRALEARAEGGVSDADSLLRSAEESTENQIYRVILRVPRKDEVLPGSSRETELLSNLQSETPEVDPYTFSIRELDLAIISLDQQDDGVAHDFADALERSGYEPIHLSDISDGPSAEGAEVFTVGYPEATALVGQVRLAAEQAHSASSWVSLPNFTWGKVSMLHDELFYFWSDMSVFPGNSGGPVIEKDKLVGIVSAQSRVPVEKHDGTLAGDFWARIPSGLTIKSGYIKGLLEVQKEKDKKARSVT